MLTENIFKFLIFDLNKYFTERKTIGDSIINVIKSAIKKRVSYSILYLVFNIIIEPSPRNII